MIVIYSRDRKYCYRSLDEAEAHLIILYGESVGKEAYDALRDAPEGYTFRINGGPHVMVVSEDLGEEILRESV